MFAELMPLLQERPVTLQAVVRDGRISLLIAPKKLKDDENPAFWTPFHACGTAEELDASLAQLLTRYAEVRKEVTTSLTEQLQAAEEAMKKAAEEAKKKAAEKAKLKSPVMAKAAAATIKPTMAATTAKAGQADDEDDEGDDEATTAPTPAAVVAEAAPQVTLF